MGVLTIQFGQCGNQIGYALFTYILKDIKETKSRTSLRLDNAEYVNRSKELWFSDNNNCCYVPRSVLVDTENKVVKSLLKKSDLLKFENVIANCGSGSANNWAFGYTTKADMLMNEVLERVRKEIEKCSDVTHIISFLSSGGGTGSGTGSRVLEALRTTYPNKIIINVIVLPYKSGEIVTQSYNSLLTLAKLYDITDGSIILENDSLHRICQTLMSIKNVDLHHMNDAIAQKLTSIFQPVDDYSLVDFVAHLTSHPNYKFVQIRSTPHIAREHFKYETTHNWQSLAGQLRKEFCTYNQLHCGENLPVASGDYNNYYSTAKAKASSCKSVGSLLISRGGLLHEPHKNAIDLLREPQFYPSWLPDTNRLLHFHQTRRLHDTEKFLSLVSNSNSICSTLDTVLAQAWNLFNHKAYLHQYVKYGITETEFETAFEKMESIVNCYKEL